MPRVTEKLSFRIIRIRIYLTTSKSRRSLMRELLFHKRVKGLFVLLGLPSLLPQRTRLLPALSPRLWSRGDNLIPCSLSLLLKVIGLRPKNRNQIFQPSCLPKGLPSSQGVSNLRAQDDQRSRTRICHSLS